MDKTKTVVSFLFLFILISLAPQSTANQVYTDTPENRDSIQLVFEKRISDTANESLKA